MTHGSNEEPGKLFVGGLSWETTHENLQRYFCRFGEVVDVVVMKNNESGRSRGFGFVTFKDPECVSIVLASGPHELDGRTIDPKSCNPRGMSTKASTFQPSKKSGNFPKIFLGGLPSTCTETDIRNFFSKYGKVGEIVIMYDQERKKSRGFGFLSFENEDVIDRVCGERYVIINGKQVECKRAEPRNSMPKGGGGGSGGGGGGGGGGSGGQSQWGGGMMGPSSWGAGPIGAPPGAGGPAGGPGAMPNGMMPGYQGGWGAQQQGPYGAQGGYGSGYQGWGGSYTPYGGAGPQYGQQGYGGYGGTPGAQGYGGYGGYPPAMGGPGAAGGPPSGQGADPYQSTGMPGGNQGGPGEGNNSGTEGGMGSYQQESSSYGPSRGFGGNNAGGNMDSFGSGSYSQEGAHGGGGGSQGGGRGGQSQNYHPYRR